LESTREKIMARLVQMEAEKMKLRDDLTVLEAEMELLTSKKIRLEQEENIKNELVERSSLAEQTHRALQDVYSEFTVEIKDKIAKEANLYFEQLLDKEGKATLNRVCL
jgi:hypothetical protein